MRTGTLRHLIVCALSLTLTLAGCGRLPRPTTPVPSAGVAVVADRLFFGRNIPGGGTVSDSAWSAFLAEVVTPRFPAGFTVFRAEGQWRGADGAVEREASFVLEVHHPQGLPSDSVFAAIGTEYCRRFRQEAVLHARAAGEQWLYRAAPR
ncbi:MAG: DUF3574 domain-containing protein [Gemmatimonadaceae bacterium]|nr:DUF3574 domain-containing protein [Gemmatimonadaceae bacterium]